MNHIPKLKADPRFVILGTESMLESLKAICEETEGVKEAKDPEHVHRMRVATRRLRARLRVFGGIFPNKQLKDWTKEIRRLTRALGIARDCDVQIIFLEEFKAAHKDEKSKQGVSRLELRIKQMRDREQAKVIKAIDRLITNRVFENMNETLRDLRVLARMQAASELPAAASIDFARGAMASGIMELIGHDIYLQDSGNVNELHQMRIAAKRLRYTMETFETWFPEVLPKAIKQIKNIQELLGDIHDCDVWTSMLPVFMEEERGRAVEFYGKPIGIGKLKPGMDQLGADRVSFRARRRQELLEFWPKMTKSQVWKNFVETMFAEPKESEKPPAPDADNSAEPETAAAESNTDGGTAETNERPKTEDEK